MLLAALGMALSIATWPHGKSTSDPWFWVRSVVLPAMFAGFVFGLRWLFYGQQVSLHEADEETDARDRAEAIRFGREHLAIIGLDYLTAMGNGNVSARIVGGERALRSQQSPTTGTTLRRTQLDILDGTDGIARFNLCLTEVMRGIRSVIQAAPSNIPLDVYIQIPGSISDDEVLSAWQACTKAVGVTLAEPLRLTKEDGLMTIDEWLDIRGGPLLEKLALFVAVQASGEAAPGNSEAAAAMVMAWSSLAERMHLDVVAKLHRPVDVLEELAVDDMSKTLLWGNTEAKEVLDMWQAGLSEADDDVLSKATSDLGLALVEADEPAGVHDIDAALGNTGEAAGWLAIALAAERASEAGTPQLVCTRQGTIRMAVVRPAEKANQAERTG
ncbi:hypothetical protein F4827_004264 [Paraburkholderia bannensis]|uniref:Uncharacterized protein n=1 Tax=Paraburkholderia bannensis TaxID=765414 RepID=A0A7W9U1V7_9BURK|nr:MULTISPECIES: hypothetical protein [Paraburkholderia]MBB3259389.1 hypothetical protein [Paraburkholderia sp. WP4_3_2]MBB6104405.1 hypothetical protein [Paraburkholderia bannensis]